MKRIDYSLVFKIIFILLYTSCLILWSYKQPLGSCPDEPMRYRIPLYIYTNNSLPNAYDLSIADENYGFSYATRPFLPSFIDVACMKICSLFSSNEDTLFFSARFGSLILAPIFVIYLFLLAKLLFDKPIRQWFFVTMVALWPQCAFLFTYVNSDALGMLAVAMIIYSAIKCLSSNWQALDCLHLAISISVGLLSYYNIYPYILCSVFLFLYCLIRTAKKHGNVLHLLKVGGLIALLCIVLAGWFFARNAYLYDGDIFGNRTINQMGLMHAIPGYSPVNRATYASDQLNTFHGWLWWFLISARSYIGCFGRMDVKLENWMYVIYILEIAIGSIAYLFGTAKKRIPLKEDLARKLMLLASSILVVFLSVLYAFSDYQPQGRYFLPTLIPFCILICKGHFDLLKGKKASIYLSTIMIINAFIFLFAYPFRF